MIRRLAPFVALAAALTLVLGGCGGGQAGGSSSSTGGSTGGSSSSGGSSTGGTTGGQIGDGGRDNTCEAALNPLDTGILVGASIKATVLTKCATPPQSHLLDVKLQRDVNGRWISQNERSWNDIPGPVAIIPRLVTASCVPGSWRVVVHIEGASASGKPFVIDHTGSIKEVQAHDCG